MSCYELRILLHYYACPQDHQDMERNPPVWRTAIDKLLDLQLLDHSVSAAQPSSRDPVAYLITERGRVFVEILLETPLPVLKWVRA